MNRSPGGWGTEHELGMVALGRGLEPHMSQDLQDTQSDRHPLPSAHCILPQSASWAGPWSCSQVPITPGQWAPPLHEGEAQAVGPSAQGHSTR